MKLAIGLVLSHGFPAPSAFWDSYETMLHQVYTGAINQDLPAHLQIEHACRFKSEGFPVDMARNEIVAKFLAHGDDALWFIDADHVFPPDGLVRLLRHDVAFVSGRYHMRRPPFHVAAYVKHRTLDGPHRYAPIHWGQGLIEVERGGAGCLLVRREVFVAIKSRIGHNWFRYQRGPDPPHDFTVSEDFWFWQQAREAGYQTWLDWDCEVKHLQQFPIDRTWNEQYLSAMLKELSALPPDGREGMINTLIACGYPEGLLLSTGDRIPNYVITPGER